MFEKIQLEGDISSMIEAVYDTKLDLRGGWGYTKEDATQIVDLQKSPLNQFEYNLAHMRVYLEMNITREKKDRYSNINLIEEERKSQDNYDLVRYRVTAMLEDEYAKFIDEYKDGYGKDEFDIEEHFERRKKATLTREIEYWFVHP